MFLEFVNKCLIYVKSLLVLTHFSPALLYSFQLLFPWSPSHHGVLSDGKYVKCCSKGKNYFRMLMRIVKLCVSQGDCAAALYMFLHTDLWILSQPFIDRYFFFTLLALHVHVLSTRMEIITEKQPLPVSQNLLKAEAKLIGVHIWLLSLALTTTMKYFLASLCLLGSLLRVFAQCTVLTSEFQLEGDYLVGGLFDIHQASDPIHHNRPEAIDCSR